MRGGSYVRKLKRRLREEMGRALKATARDARTVARAYSAGSRSRVQLAQAGHPYATRNPRPPGDPAVINRQSGTFYRAWRIEGPRVFGASGELAAFLINDAPQAGYLDKGTRRMIARPIRARIEAMIRATHGRHFQRALRRLQR